MPVPAVILARVDSIAKPTIERSPGTSASARPQLPETIASRTALECGYPSSGPSASSFFAAFRTAAVRDQLDHVIVQLGHRLVERGEPGTSGPGELDKVSVGYLAMADDSLNGNTGVLDIIGPEFVPWVGGGPAENCLRGGGR